MQENIVAKILFIIGIAQMVVGLLLGIIFANTTYGLVWSTFFTWAIGGFVTGMVFIGFSEVIKLLHSINGKMEHRSQSVVNETNAKNLDVFESVETDSNPVNWTLDEADKGKIYYLYANENVVEIIPSLLEGYCLVKLESETGQYVRVVTVGSFGAEEVQDEKTKHTIISWYNTNEQ